MFLCIYEGKLDAVVAVCGEEEYLNSSINIGHVFWHTQTSSPVDILHWPSIAAYIDVSSICLSINIETLQVWTILEKALLIR